MRKEKVKTDNHTAVKLKRGRKMPMICHKTLRKRIKNLKKCVKDPSDKRLPIAIHVLSVL